MSRPPAGTTKKGFLSRDDYIAPLPIPTGEKPVDVLSTIWRKNDVFLDIGNYSVGAGVMMIWCMALLFFGMYCIDPDPYIALGGCVIVGIPALMLIHGLFRKVHPPMRFNRQRREVCVSISTDEYWIVPWEKVVAVATEQSSVGQAGRTSTGLLIMGFENPDPDAAPRKKNFSYGFACGGGTTAMALWECTRSYMEIGPDAVPESRVGVVPYEESQIGSTLIDLRNGNVLGFIWGILSITLLGTYLAEKLQNLKLSNPPQPDFPEIIEWSKPLPPEQWAKRSTELEVAIARREAEFARQRARELA